MTDYERILRGLVQAIDADPYASLSAEAESALEKARDRLRQDGPPPLLDYHRLYSAWTTRWHSHEAERRGQALWNAARELAPNTVEPLRGTDVDPFCDDKKIEAFFKALTGRGS